jgi:uncharacterized membrane protein YheB (UPF0754 family)
VPEQLVQALLTVGLGALAGGLTNSVAIWMLFHPYEPPLLFGRWRLRLFQGAIPKSQTRLAAAIGRTVGNRLLTAEDLATTFADREFREAFDQRLAHLVGEILTRERGSLRQLIPPALLGDIEALIEDGVERGVEQLDQYVASERFADAVARRTNDIVAAVADEPIAGVLTSTRGAAVETAVQEWLQGVVESDDFAVAVNDYLDRAAQKLLVPGRTFEEILPIGLVGSVERAIASYLPLAAERLGGLLEDPNARDRFEAMLHDLLRRFLRDLKFHQRVVARLVMTDETVDKVLDTIEAEGAERLSEILRDPAVQEAMARGVNQAIVDFLRRPVASVLGDPEDPNVVETKRTLTGWITGMARDPATREFLVEKLHEGLEKAGAKTWGEVLERVPRERVAEAFVGVARTEGARRAVAAGIRRFVAQLMDRPIGTPARWLPADGPTRIEAALADPIWEWLQTQVPTVVQRIDVARRVEEKVRHFPMPHLEEMVRRVTDRELKLIVRLGYLLGAMIGVLMLTVDALLT